MPENTSPNAVANGSKAKAAQPPRQFKRLALSQIRPSRKNPRLIKRPEMIAARAASMAENGQTNPIIVRPLTPAEPANDGVLYEIADGELRYWAALKNGDTEIDAQIQELSPLQAFKKGISANRLNKPVWFEDYIAMEDLENAGGIQKQEIAALFEVEPTIVSRAIRILTVLNEASRDLILKNLQKSTDDWQIAENTLNRLTDLGDPQAVEAALRVALDRQMTEPQAKNLVAHVNAGNPPETCSTPKKPKTVKTPKTKVAETPSHSQAGAPPAAHPVNSTPPVTQGVSPSHAPTHPATAKAASASEAESVPTPKGLPHPSAFFWEWVAGISIFSQIKSKLEKGENLSGGEYFLLVVHRIGQGLAWLGKHVFKLIGHILKFVWKLLKHAFKAIVKRLPKKGFIGQALKTAGLVFWIALIGAFAWFVLDVRARGIFHPFKVIGSKFASKPTAVPTQAPRPQVAASLVKASGNTSAQAPTPVISAAVVDDGTSNETAAIPTVQPTPNANGNNGPLAQSNPVSRLVVSTQTPKTDLAGAVLKQAGPDIAKKLFGL